MATCGPGDAIVLARNCHLSAFSACVLAGCHPVWVDPVVDPCLGVAHGVTPEALAEGFRTAAMRGRRAAAALVVSPTYFGVCSDLAGARRGGLGSPTIAHACAHVSVRLRYMRGTTASGVCPPSCVSAVGSVHGLALQMQALMHLRQTHIVPTIVVVT